MKKQIMKARIMSNFLPRRITWEDTQAHKFVELTEPFLTEPFSLFYTEVPQCRQCSFHQETNMPVLTPVLRI